MEEREIHKECTINTEKGGNKKMRKEEEVGKREGIMNSSRRVHGEDDKEKEEKGRERERGIMRSAVGEGREGTEQ